MSALITKPTPVWLPEEEIYLHSIQQSCEHLSKLYLAKYKACKSLQTKLKLPAIIVGSFTGIASFGSDSFPPNSQKYVSISVGIITIGIAILNTIESYLKVGENTNSAITAASALQQLREDIHRELSLPISDRIDSGIVFLRDIYTRYVQILTQAPILENEENMSYIKNNLMSRKINLLINNSPYYNGRPSESPLDVSPAMSETRKKKFGFLSRKKEAQIPEQDFEDINEIKKKPLEEDIESQIIVKVAGATDEDTK